MNLKNIKNNGDKKPPLFSLKDQRNVSKSETNTSFQFTVDEKHSSNIKDPLKPKKKMGKVAKSLLFLFLILLVSGFGYLGYYYNQNLNTLKDTGVEGVGILDPFKYAFDAAAAKNDEPLSKLQKDEDRTNFLLLGVDARSGFSSFRTDSIIIASYNHTTKDVVEFSLPRDTQATYSKNIVSKINAIFQFTFNDAKNRDKLSDEEAIKKGFSALSTAINEVTGLKIHYGVMVNFTALKDIVDALGGITVNVDKDLYDNTFPNESDTGTVIVNIKAGVQNMNGTKALQYARSRHSTSDYDRARRQQIVVNAIREKFTKSNFFTDVNAINKIIEAVSKNVRFYNVTSDVISEVIRSREVLNSITTASVVLDPNIGATTGQVLRGGEPVAGAGFLVYPVSGKYDDLKEIVQIYLKNPGLLSEDASVRVVYTNSNKSKDFNAIVKEIRDEQKQPFVYFTNPIKVSTTTTGTSSPTKTASPTNSPTPTSTEKKVVIYTREEKPKTLAYYQEVLKNIGFTTEVKPKEDLPKELEKIYEDSNILIVVS